MSYMDIVYQIKTFVSTNPYETLKYSTLGYIAFEVLKKLKSIYDQKSKHKKILQLALEKRESRDNLARKFSNEYRNSEDLHQRILKSSVLELKELLKNKEVTSRQLIVSYAQQCVEVGLPLNLLADANFEEAYAQAENADWKMKTTDNKDWPPLLGIPISIKDNIHIKGLVSTSGFGNRANNIQDRDSYLVKVLRELGAIPFVKSNIPQGLLASESMSSNWGLAKNPWNPNKSVGGSSGGEGGLVASKCSPIGIGNDIGGSIRIPGTFNGNYSLRPSSRRISLDGMDVISGKKYDGFSEIRVSNGPLAQTMDDLIFFCQNIFNKFDDDHETLYKPFNKKTLESSNKLKIGFISNTNVCELATCIKDAIDDCVGKLRSKGHTLVPFSTNMINDLWLNTLDIFYGGQEIQQIKEGLQGEYLHSYYAETDLLTKLPPWLIKSIGKLYNLIGMKRDAELIKGMKCPVSASEFIEVCRTHTELVSEFKKKWREEGFDAVILPVVPFPAYDHGGNDNFIHYCKYTFMFNNLDFPAGTVPVGLVENTEFSAPIYNDAHYKAMSESLKSSKGLPVCLQVATMSNDDELCLRVMKEVDNFYRFDKTHSPKILDIVKKRGSS